MPIDAADLKRRYPIAGVVSRYVGALRPSGAALVARCPFHRDGGRPNLHLYPRSSRWVCYRCGRRGDTIDFVREIEHVGFREAVALIAGGCVDVAPMPARREPSPEPASRVTAAGVTDPAGRACVAAAVDVYRRRFLAEPAALAYCAGRGLDVATLARHRVGFAAGGDLLPELRRRGLPPDAAVRAGLLVPRRDGGYREALAGRVVVPELRPGGPIWLLGRVVAERPGAPRYLGLRGIRKPLLGLGLVRGAPIAYVTEGPFDVLTLSAWGLPAVALCGTLVGPQAIAALARFPRLVLALDADDAGQQATAALLDALGPRAHAVELPGVADVADLATRPDGRERFLDVCALARGQEPRRRAA